MRCVGGTPTAMDVLSKSPWPGNIRELENVIERAVILTMSPYISEKDLPPSLMSAYPHAGSDTAIL